MEKNNISYDILEEDLEGEDRSKLSRIKDILVYNYKVDPDVRERAKRELNQLKEDYLKRYEKIIDNSPGCN